MSSGASPLGRVEVSPSTLALIGGMIDASARRKNSTTRGHLVARRYENGVVVGEPNPPPKTTLEEWIRAEVFRARDLGNYDRAQAYVEALYQMKLRGMADVV